MRYFLEFAYNGTRYCGYQEQSNQSTIQSAVQHAVFTILREPIKIVGCGRTDSGVHALQYFAHFDTDQILSEEFVFKLNSLIGKDIVFYNIYKVQESAHARFDATSRSYQYVIDFNRSPFRQECSFFCTYAARLDVNKMIKAVEVLKLYKDFTTFRKSRTDTKTKICDLRRSEWIFDDRKKQLIYHVTADRFLRGMIRLIVGMSLNVGKGKISIDSVVEAMENKKILANALSAPAKGLFLRDIKYAYIDGHIT